MYKLIFPHSLSHPGRRYQHGVVLVVVLLFMLALSTIAIFGARNATLGERQARNEGEYQVARQAAEAALRDGERDLTLTAAIAPAPPACPRDWLLFRSDEQLGPEGEFDASCTGGQCWLPLARYAVTWSAATDTSGASPGEPWWPVSKGGMWTPAGDACSNYTGAVPLGRYTGVAPLGGVSKQPEYLIEYLANPNQDPNAVSNKDLTVRTFECLNPMIGGEPGAAYSGGTPDTSIPKSKCVVFRISARGFGPSSNTEVVMQSYFRIMRP